MAADAAIQIWFPSSALPCSICEGLFWRTLFRWKSCAAVIDTRPERRSGVIRDTDRHTHVHQHVPTRQGLAFAAPITYAVPSASPAMNCTRETPSRIANVSEALAKNTSKDQGMQGVHRGVALLLCVANRAPDADDESAHIRQNGHWAVDEGNARRGALRVQSDRWRGAPRTHNNFVVESAARIGRSARKGASAST